MATSELAMLWGTLLEVVKTAQACCEQWQARGKLTQGQAAEIISELQTRHAEYTQSSAANLPLPPLDGYLPLQTRETPGVRGYRASVFVGQLLEDLRSQGKVTLSQFHGLQADSNERLRAVRRSLTMEGISESELKSQCDPIRQPAEAATAPVSAPVTTPMSAELNEQQATHPPVQAELVAEFAGTEKPQRNILEILLDPRSIQCLLGLGGALMVVGIVILLWINNYFTPPVMAVVLALGNSVLLAAGMATIRFTRYHLAGKALTLLSCFVMPLNLWYCHSNELITIDGHLWIAAVVISGLYAAAAITLKDELFVYVFCAGVTMTGLLIVADLTPSPQRFWEIASPATLLVILGLLGIHLERAFAVGDGPFSRGRFGMAFFWSGHMQLAVGLLLVLGAQVAGDWLYPFWFRPLFDSFKAIPSPICDRLVWLAMCLVLAGTYAYIYSDLVVRKKGIFIHFAAFTLLWSEVLIVDFLDLKLGVDAIIAILAVTSLVIHVVHFFASDKTPYTRSFPLFGLLLGVVPVLIGLVVFLDYFGLQAVWTTEPPRWSFIGAMLLTAVACRVGAYVSQKSSTALMMPYFFATGAALMIASVASLAALGLNRWQSHAPIMMLIPIAYLIAAKLYGERDVARPVLWVAHGSAIVMLVSSLASAFQGFDPGGGVPSLHLSLALFFAEAAVFYGLATYFRRQPLCVYVASFMACAAFWQLLTYFNVGTQAYILSFAIVGLLMLVAYRLSLIEKTAAAPLTEALFQSSNGLLSLAFVSSIFYGLSQLAREGLLAGNAVVDWGFAGFCLTMVMINLAATWITQHAFGKRWYVVTSVGQAIVLLLAVHNLIDLNPWQQVELFLVFVGVVMLITGHLGWYREQDRQTDLVSMSLLFGSLLASVPLAIATWIDRGHNVFYPINEFGFLFISVVLLASGILFQLKATTVVGTVMTILYFLTLLIFVPWGRLNTVALTITIGGSLIFGTGLILAFFRDRLLALPDRISKREGAFRVFNWR